MTISTLDIAEVERFLAERYPDVDEVVALAGGQWSRAFAFTSSGRALVVRFGHHAQDHAKDRFAAQRWGSTLPIPQVVELGEAHDGVYAVSHRAPGVVVDQLPEPDLHDLLPALVATVRTIRQLELPGQGFGPWDADTGDAPFPTWAAYLRDVPDRSEDRLVGWRSALAAHTGAAEVFAAGCSAMETLVEVCPDLRGVIHDDLLAGNVLSEGGRITAVLDWGNSLAGDPLYDVAWLLYWAPWHPGLDTSRIRELADDLLTGDDVEARLRTYALHIALDHQQYSAWTGDEDGLAWNTAQVRSILAT